LAALLVLFVAQSASAGRAHHGFFTSLSEEQKDQVSEILHSGKSKKEIKEQLRHWVSGQPKETQEAFRAAEKVQESKRVKMHARRQQLLAKVSPGAKELDEKMLAIYKDQTLTKEETCQKVAALIKATSEAVKKELKLKEMKCDF